MVGGMEWCLKNGYATEEDVQSVEQKGRLQPADPGEVSEKAFKRGIDQLGTLGSGNHYLEIEVVKDENIYDRHIAARYGIDRPDQIVVYVHCGSRGFGHQVATDYLQVFTKAVQKYGITINDKELACAPFSSDEGQSYFRAMNCAANNAFANRQIMTHQIRRAFAEVFQRAPEELGLQTVYDVAHNIAKVETYNVGGRAREVLVHRKGATRSFGPGADDLPAKYKDVGQPVLVGGPMQSGSYILAGTALSSEETYGSTLHGAGRTLSRMKAKKRIRGDQLRRQMEAEGIQVRAASMRGLAEEAGFAYKNIDDVIEAVDTIGISRKVAKLLPIGNIKG
jgi:tRNA-splicing ligase RtcB